MCSRKAIKCQCGRYLTRRRSDSVRLEGLGWRVRLDAGGMVLSKECGECGELNLVRVEDIFPPPA